MKATKGYRRLIFFDFIPIIAIHIIFLPFWYSRNNLLRTNVTSMEMIFSIISPLYLLLINLIHSVNYKVFNFLSNIALMLVAAMLGICLYYFNWGISTGNLLSPDAETVLYFAREIQSNLMLILAFGLIWQVILLFLKYSAKTA